jgi:hypothetical protein
LEYTNAITFVTSLNNNAFIDNKCLLNVLFSYSTHAGRSDGCNIYGSCKCIGCCNDDKKVVKIF